MPDVVADSPDLTCSHLNSKSKIQKSQSLGVDPSSPHARDARVRGFAKGSSGNPRGRPRGIRNPRRRVPDLIARPLSAQALSDLLDRKPHLLGLLAVQLLPPPLKPIDPADRLGIDLSSLRTAEDLRELLPKVLAAIARGEITPAEGARLARRARTRLRAIRRLARFQRRLARQMRLALPGDHKVGPKLVSNSTDTTSLVNPAMPRIVPSTQDWHFRKPCALDARPYRDTRSPGLPGRYPDREPCCETVAPTGA
jgi:hypothetical protein